MASYALQRHLGWRTPKPKKYIYFFSSVFRLFTASVQAWSLDQPLVPGVFTYFFLFLRLLLFTHFGETPEAENLFPPIFWHN